LLYHSTLGPGVIKKKKKIVVGGANGWAFSTFVNYDFFPSKVHFI